MDTYVWQAKNNQEDMQVYDVDVVYGTDTFPPVGFEKCNKTLTPQLPSESQSFLCYRTINEGDKESIEQRALEMMTSALSISATANETKTSFEEQPPPPYLTAPTTPMTPMTAPSSMSPSTPMSPSSPGGTPLSAYGKVLTLEMLGILASIVSTPSAMYNPSCVESFVAPFVNKVYRRLTMMSDLELNSLDMDTLNSATLPGLVTLQQICDSLAVTSSGGASLLNNGGDGDGNGNLSSMSSMSKQLQMFQLTLTRKFLTCGYLQKRLSGVDMLMEWVRCARLNDANRAEALQALADQGGEKKKEKGSSSSSTTNRLSTLDEDAEDSDDSNDSTNDNKWNTTGANRGRVVYSSGYGGGRYGTNYNSMYGRNNYNNYNNQYHSSDDEDAIPSHAEWITVEILLEWFESASIVEVLLMGNKHLSEQARKLHATHPTAETTALCRMERYPGVMGHPQVAKKSFQFNKNLNHIIHYISISNLINQYLNSGLK